MGTLLPSGISVVCREAVKLTVWAEATPAARNRPVTASAEVTVALSEFGPIALLRL